MLIENIEETFRIVDTFRNYDKNNNNLTDNVDRTSKYSWKKEVFKL